MGIGEWMCSAEFEATRALQLASSKYLDLGLGVLIMILLVRQGNVKDGEDGAKSFGRYIRLVLSSLPPPPKKSCLMQGERRGPRGKGPMVLQEDGWRGEFVSGWSGAVRRNSPFL